MCRCLTSALNARVEEGFGKIGEGLANKQQPQAQKPDSGKNAAQARQ